MRSLPFLSVKSNLYDVSQMKPAPRGRIDSPVCQLDHVALAVLVAAFLLERRAERVEVAQALPLVFHEASDTISDPRRHVCNLRHNRKPLQCSAPHSSSLSCSLPNQPLAFPLLDLQPAYRQAKHAFTVLLDRLPCAAGRESAGLHIGSRLTLAQAHVTALLVPAWA